MLQTRCTQTAGPLVKVLQSLQSTLGYQYHASWSLSLQVLSTLTQTLADSCSQQLVNVCVIDLTTVKHCCGSISHQTSLSFSNNIVKVAFSNDIVKVAYNMLLFNMLWLASQRGMSGLYVDNGGLLQLTFFVLTALPQCC